MPSFMRPPEERSAASILTIVLVVLFALFVLYKGADWWLAKRAVQHQQRPALSKPEAATQGARPPLPSEQPQARPANPRPAERPAYPAPQAGSVVVTKCVAKDKTSYSEGACPPGSIASAVAIDPRVNLIEAPRVPVTTPAVEAPVAAQPSNSVRVSQGNDAHFDRKAECQGLNAYIEKLDAWARQPQSAQTQDWIRDERKKARDRQFGIRC
jgi:hypothetical protein